MADIKAFIGRHKILTSVVGVVVVLIAVGVIVVMTQTTHHTMSGPPAPITPSGDKVLDSIRKGIEYLKVNQESDGEFSAGLIDPKPAFTALVVDALSRSPDRLDMNQPFVAKAVKAILSHQKEDGGIYSLGLGNYVTSVSVMALERMGDLSLKEPLDRAASYLKGNQRPSGGMGYGSSGRADLSNTMLSLEALNKVGLEKDDDVYKRAAAFISQCQNDRENNTAAWATHDGGFVYRPGKSPAGEYEEDGQTRLRSYGLMTYAGLVSFLWAGVDREDDRVKSAFRWVRNNWTLEENCNVGTNGLYYYYLTMAKALRTYGVRVIETSDGVKHDWPVELADKIMSAQRDDGSWVNDNTSYFEGDSVMVTAYMVRSLSICHEVINAKSGGTDR